MGEECDGGHLQVASMKLRVPCLSSSVAIVAQRVLTGNFP